MATAVQQWTADLAQWSIPDDIIKQAPQSPWIHSPALFEIPAEIVDSLSHRRAREALSQAGSVIDVGCGGGVATFAIAPPAQQVTGVDHQSSMLDLYSREAEKRGIKHAEVLGDWPDVSGQVATADVVVCHNVAYNVSKIVPFLQALNDHALKRVIIEIPMEHPLAPMRGLWKHFWDLERPYRPSAQTFFDVVTQSGFEAHMEQWQAPAREPVDFDQHVEFTSVRLCLAPQRRGEVATYLRANPAPPTRSVATIWWDIPS
jgi:SAM-dependent methyltransferase